MATEEPQLTFEQPRSVFSTWVAVVLMFSLFALLAWAVMGAMSRSDNYEQKRAETRLEKLKTAREEWAKSQGGYGWTDKAKGGVRLPIDRAMELTMHDLAQKKPAPATPLPPEGNQIGAQQTAPVTPAAPPVAPAGGPRPSDKPRATEVEGKDSETHGQPAAAANPPNAQPGTQPGPSNTPAASPGSAPDRPPQMPTPPQLPASPPGTPLPVPGKTP